MPVPHCLDYCCSLVLNFKIGEHESSTFLVLFKIVFGYSGSLAFPHECKYQFYIFFCKNSNWNFVIDYVGFLDQFGEYCQLNIKSFNPGSQHR